MKKWTFYFILLVFISTSLETELCFSGDYDGYNNPCNSPIATCETKADGSRWCGMPQQTMMLCSSPGGNFNLSTERQSPTMEAYTPPSCWELCEASYNDCMARSNEERAREGAGEFSALIDASKYTNCEVSRNRCSNGCK